MKRPSRNDIRDINDAWDYANALEKYAKIEDELDEREMPEPTLRKCPYCEGYISQSRFFNIVECLHCGRKWKDE